VFYVEIPTFTAIIYRNKKRLNIACKLFDVVASSREFDSPVATVKGYELTISSITYLEKSVKYLVNGEITLSKPHKL